MREKMKTYQITENEIKGMPVLATGYKIFNNDWTTKNGKYDYRNKNGEVLNTIHKVDGDIRACSWGLHFSKLPYNCFNFYESLQWNKFAKVEAYGQCIDSDKKSVASIIKIVEIYSFDEFIKLIHEKLQNNDITGGNDIRGGNDIWGGNYIRGGNDIRGGNYIWGGNDIRGGNDIKGGNDIWGGNDIAGGNYIWGGSHIKGGNDIWGGNDIRGGNYIWGGNDIRGGNYIWGGNYIRGGNYIWGGNYIRGGNYIKGGNYIWGGNGIAGGNDITGGSHIKGGNDITGGNDIWGGNDIKGGNYIWGGTKLIAVYKCVFCYNKRAKEFYLFNKESTEERIDEIIEKLNSFGWYPKFNNAYDLKGDLEWYETNIPNIVKVDNKTAWSFMPKEMKDYIESLPEFDKEVFDKVTGDIEND